MEETTFSKIGQVRTVENRKQQRERKHLENVKGVSRTKRGVKETWLPLPSPQQPGRPLNFSEPHLLT